MFDWLKPNEYLSPLFAAVDVNQNIAQPPDQQTESPLDVKAARANRNCDYGLIAAPSVFVVSNTTVNSQLCVRNFHWPSTIDNGLESHITLNGINIGATAFLDLTSHVDSEAALNKVAGQTQLELLGLNA